MCNTGNHSVFPTKRAKLCIDKSALIPSVNLYTKHNKPYNCYEERQPLAYRNLDGRFRVR